MEFFTYKATISRVVDGDTVDVFVDLGFYTMKLVRVRLLDVDAPEMHSVKHNTPEYAKGKACAEFVEQWAQEHPDVVVKTEKTGKFGRWLGTIYALEEGVEIGTGQCLNDAVNGYLKGHEDGSVGETPVEGSVE